MNKRDLVLSLLDRQARPATVPAAFFLHLDPAFHFGQAAVGKHVEFFRATGMDLVKIQYERNFPHWPEVRRPADWRKVPSYGLEFYAPQLEAVEGIVRALKREAVVVVTLYSPFICAEHAVGEEVLLAHVREDPTAVAKGMEAITESLLTFVKACVAAGVDGFYHSTQGGEIGRLEVDEVFDQVVRPFDLVVMEEVRHGCTFNILHVCDYVGGYRDLSRFAGYPGHVVSCPLQAGGEPLSLTAAAGVFDRPVMGGLDRHGALAHGSEDEIRAAVQAVLRAAPERFILGADCTVPADTPWGNLRSAIEAAHAWRRA